MSACMCNALVESHLRLEQNVKLAITSTIQALTRSPRILPYKLKKKKELLSFYSFRAKIKKETINIAQ
jgi:hypothetical protein